MCCLSRKTRGNWSLSVHVEMGSSWLKSGIWHNSFSKCLATLTQQPSHSSLPVGLCRLTFPHCSSTIWPGVCPHPWKFRLLRNKPERWWEETQCHAKAEVRQQSAWINHSQTACTPEVRSFMLQGKQDSQFVAGKDCPDHACGKTINTHEEQTKRQAQMSPKFLPWFSWWRVTSGLHAPDKHRSGTSLETLRESEMQQ